MILPIMLPIQIQIFYTPVIVSKLSHVIVNSSAICIIISVIVVLANLIDFFINGYNNDSSAVILIHTFFTLFVLFAVLCIVGALKRLLVCLKVAFIVWVVLLVVWLTTCSVQFTTWYSVPVVCINNRCAESLWLSDFFYLAFEEFDNETNTSTTKPPNNTSHVQLQNTTQKPDDGSSRSKILLRRNYLFITLFVIVFVSFFFFFIFLGSMVYSYHDSLCYLTEEDQVVTVPPAAYIFILPFRGFYEARTSFGPAEVPEDKNKAGTSDDKKTEGPQPRKT